ncbi:MAG TPA: hypothetical protein VFX59_13240 [Polyangiales bacterium]|nr:hypothetical protein [Polyangiales bacterium]
MKLPWSALFALCMVSSTLAHGAGGAERYAGVHGLGVNRVSVKRRPGTVTFSQSGDGWQLSGEAREGPWFLRVTGSVLRVDDRELVLQGELHGVPDMRWAGEAPRERTTHGKLTFRATKGRKFWRLYEVDEQDCVCDEGCGNDWCYIDIDLAAKRVPAIRP